MFRKFALVIVAVCALGAATLTPTPASAWRGGWHGGWHGGGWGGWRGGWGPGWRRAGWGPGWGWRRGWGWGAPVVVASGFYGGGCVVRRLVPGPWGVNRCW